MLLLIFSKDASPAQIVSPCFSPAFSFQLYFLLDRGNSFQLYFLLDRGNIRGGGGGGGGCPFSPADVSLLVQTAAEMNQEGCCCYFIVVVLLLFYSGGVVVIL